MSNHPFFIQNIVFDIDFFSKEKAYDLQNRVSRLFSQRLTGQMQQVFDKTVPDDVFIKGGNIVLDIGTISYNNFEKELSAKFETALVDFFSAFLLHGGALHHQSHAPNLSIVPLTSTYLSLFENFLLTGVLPSYAAAGGLTNLEKKLDELFDTMPEKLASLIISAGQMESIRKRLGYQFSEPFIRKVIQVLEPVEARFIIAYKENISKVHEQSPLVTSDAETFHRALWVFILTFLIVEKGSLFSRREFARSTFKKIAARFNIEYEALLFLLKEGIIVGSAEASQSELISLIYILTTENTPVDVSTTAHVEMSEVLQAETKPKQQIISASTRESYLQQPTEEVGETVEEKKEIIEPKQFSSPEIQWLNYYLEHGSLPPEAYSVTISEIRDLFLSLLSAKQAEGKQILSRFPIALIQKRSSRLGINYRAEIVKTQNHFLLQRDNADVPFIESSESVNVNSMQYKEDLLYYFMRTGFLPWWASQQPVSLQTLLEELLHYSPGKVLQLFKWAGKEEKHKTRFVNQFSSSVFISMITNLPDGVVAATAFKQILSLTDDERDKMPGISLRFFHLLWNNYILCNYLRFDEVSFYVEAVKEVATTYNLPPEILQLPLIMLIEKKSINVLQKAIREFRQTGNASGTSYSSVLLSEEELIGAVLSLVSEPFSMGESPVTEAELSATRNRVAGKGGSSQLTLALINHIRYFFEHRSLPFEVTKKIQVSADVFCKAALLLLHKTAEEEAEKLINEYYKKAGLQTLLPQWFSRNDYREKAVLAGLNKVAMRYADDLNHEDTSDTLNLSSFIVQPVPQGQSKSIPELLLFHQYYETENLSSENKIEKAKLTLQHFLTWQTVPQAETVAMNTLPDEILKEIVVFLFNSSRSSLQLFLQSRTNMPEAIIRLAGMFKAEKGGEEALLIRFMQPYTREAAIDCLWKENIKADEKTGAAQMAESAVKYDVLTFLNNSISAEKDTNQEIEASVWLDHFLTYNQLPQSLSRYSEEAVIMAVLIFLTSKNKALVKKIFQKETHLLSARMKLYDWLQNQSASLTKEVLAIAEGIWQCDMLIYLQQASGDLPEAIKNNTQLLWKSNLPPGKKKRFIQAIARHQTVREEWAKEASLPDIYHLLKEENPALAKQYSYIITVITKLVHPVLQQGYERDSFSLQCKVFLLLMVTGSITLNNPLDFITRFFVYLDNRKPAFIPLLYHNLHRSWNEVTETVTIEPLIKKGLQQTIASRLSSPAFALPVQESSHKKKAQPPVPVQPSIPVAGAAKAKDNAASTNQHEESGKPQLNIEPGTKLHVTNAGLVLLHPFISTYFMLTGLAEKNEFVNEEARQRAVLLLQYAVFNTTQYEEQTLVLNKLLCGFPLEEPVPSFLLPTEKETKITTELFTIIFQRWERMKNATADGFRHSFLQREGRLTKGEKKWTLRVEQRGYDAMLQTLPWAFGLVNLPWMPLAIETEWI